MTERAPHSAASHETAHQGYNHNALNDAYEEFYRNKAKKQETSPEPTRPELDAEKEQREAAARDAVKDALDDKAEVDNSPQEKLLEEAKKAATDFWKDVLTMARQSLATRLKHKRDLEAHGYYRDMKVIEAILTAIEQGDFFEPIQKSNASVDYHTQAFRSGSGQTYLMGSYHLTVPQINQNLQRKATEAIEKYRADLSKTSEVIDDEAPIDNPEAEKSPEELKTEAMKLATTFWQEQLSTGKPIETVLARYKHYLAQAELGIFNKASQVEDRDGNHLEVEPMKDYLRTLSENWPKNKHSKIKEWGQRAGEILKAIEAYEAAAGEVVDGEIVPDDEALPKHDKKDTVDTDAEADHINPEALADAQKLASAYWNKRRKNAQDHLKNSRKDNGGFDFDLARSEAYLKQIKNGEFFEDFPLTGLYKGERRNTQAKSVYEFFKSIANDDLEAYKAGTTDPETIAAIAVQEEQIKIAAEIVKAIEAIGSKDTYTPVPDKPDDTPDHKTKPAPKETEEEKQRRLDDYRRLAEEAAKASAEAYEKSPARAKAREREFWRHYNELKIEQMAERHKVEAEDEERERLKKEAEAKLAAEAQALANKQAHILKEINNAAKTKGRVERVKKLTDLAMRHSGEPGPDGIKDLGVEAAKRISKTQSLSKLNPLRLLPTPNKKDSLYVLRKMAVQKDNHTAAKSIPWVRFTRKRNINKGRWGVNREASKKNKKK